MLMRAPSFTESFLKGRAPLVFGVNAPLAHMAMDLYTKKQRVVGEQTNGERSGKISYPIGL